MDWSDCPIVEVKPDVHRGRPVPKGTRMPADDIVENWEAGVNESEIAANFRLPIAQVKAPELLAAFRRILDRGLIETAHRTRADCSQVFRFAVATGRCMEDPTRHLRGALPPVNSKHFAAITDPKKVGARPVTCDPELSGRSYDHRGITVAAPGNCPSW